MKKADIIVIGAGATGLMAARILVKSGKKVTVLEARNRCGGRIHTISDELFLKNTELGAEFIHGDLPVTLNLLNEAGIRYHPADTEMWHYNNGKFSTGVSYVKEWELLLKKLNLLKSDITINKFLQIEFPGEKYSDLRKSVQEFVSGYDTADPNKASAFALRVEWQSEGHGSQHRIDGGYGSLIKYLENEILNSGGCICMEKIVKEIHWQKGKVKVITNKKEVYTAAQIIIALPLGVLQLTNTEKGAVTFHPAIIEQSNAIQAMGFGAVIKILLEFSEAFWEDDTSEKLAGKSLKNMGYLFSDEIIPTWWTQVPQHTAVFTGWVGGPAAVEKMHYLKEELLKQSLQSLGNIFKRTINELKEKLLVFKIIDWTIEPFTRGAYAYDTIETPASRKLLKRPIMNTIYFSGEYLYEGPAMGTVEAALTSGEEAAKKISCH